MLDPPRFFGENDGRNVRGRRLGFIQRAGYFILIFVAGVIPCALVEWSIYRSNGVIDQQYLILNLATPFVIAAIAVFQSGKIFGRVAQRNQAAADLTKNPLLPPATFRIEKAAIKRYRTISLEGAVTKGTLQKGMGFSVSGDNGMAISLLLKRRVGSLLTRLNSVRVDLQSAQELKKNNTDYNPLQMRATPEDGALYLLGRSFGRLQPNDLQSGMEITFSDSAEFRMTALRPLMPLNRLYLVIAVISFVVPIIYMLNNEPDHFQRLVSLFYP